MEVGDEKPCSGNIGNEEAALKVLCIFEHND